jgi:hypothetical protein
LFVSCIVELSGNPATREITRIPCVREAIPASLQDQVRIGYDRAATRNLTGAPRHFSHPDREGGHGNTQNSRVGSAGYSKYKKKTKPTPTGGRNQLAER